MRHLLPIAMLLAAPALVWADCGWVLWKKTIATTIPRAATSAVSATTDWEPQDGFDQIAMCHEGATHTLKSTAAHLGGPFKADVSVHTATSSLTAWMPERQGQTIVLEVAFACFPGAFDPRRP